MDPALRIGRYLRGAVGRAYGLEVIREDEGDVGYRWTRCGILEHLRRDGTEGLAICEGHEAWWREIAKSVEGAPEVRVTQNMRDGAPWCEVWLRAQTGKGRGRG